MSPGTDEPIPLNLRLNRDEQQLHITWADGASSVLDARTIRSNCPCAACRQIRADSNPLKVLPVRTDARIVMTGARLVGKYALQITWSDGHDTGIFDFRLLRSLGRPG